MIYTNEEDLAVPFSDKVPDYWALIKRIKETRRELLKRYYGHEHALNSLQSAENELRKLHNLKKKIIPTPYSAQQNHSLELRRSKTK